MRLREKEYLRIYALDAIVQKKEWKFLLKQEQVKNYAEEISLTKCTAVCEGFLNLSEHIENDWICIRPMEIKKGAQFSISLEGKAAKSPVFIEIAAKNTGDDLPRSILLLNHESNELLFQEERGEFVISYKKEGNTIDELLEKTTEDILWTTGELEEYFKKKEELAYQKQEKQKQQLECLMQQSRHLKEQNQELQQQLQGIQEQISKQEEEYRKQEEERKQILAGMEEIEEWKTIYYEKIDGWLEEAKKTKAERTKLLKGYQSHIQFLEQLAKYYPGDIQAGLLAQAKEDLASLETMNACIEQLEIADT